MPRPALSRLLLAVLPLSATAAAAACGASDEAVAEKTTADAGAAARDGAVAQPEGGVSSDATPPAPSPSCETYCQLIQANCEGVHAQYASTDACLAFCEHLAPGEPGETSNAATVSCRQALAGSPALTDPATYCQAAGPFGGGRCGDRCTTFCEVTWSACSPKAVGDAGADGSPPPYASLADCKSACAEFRLVTAPDAGDGGGEGLDGPTSGDTLNCRLYYLRGAVEDPAGCANVAQKSPACR